MDNRNNPVHEADRMLEKVQALLTLIHTVAEGTDDDVWLDNRHGVCIIAEQAKEAADAARGCLDKI